MLVGNQLSVVNSRQKSFLDSLILYIVMFDISRIVVKAGRGGDGVISFRREKFVPFGGPDGGDGGKGGDVSIRAESSVASLHKFARKRFYRAADGKHGMGKKKHGRSGEDLLLTVPAGTVVWYETGKDEKVLVADLEQEGQQVVVARGGGGGWSNTHFTSSTNQAPFLAQRGEDGEEYTVVLEMRLIADVGIIGYPNVGKSTLLAAASSAKPKIASYPFTTLEPVLGVVQVDQQNFVIAEIPGLVEGAHLGRGLGHDFLRHAMRTRMFIHLIDGNSASPVEDMVQVNNELSLFDPFLAQKPQLIAVNKTDLPEVQARLSEIKYAFNSTGYKVFFLAAMTGEGVSQLMAETLKTLNKIASEGEKSKAVPQSVKVFRPRPRDGGVSVRKEGDSFVLVAPEIERIFTRGRVSASEMRWQLQKIFSRLGITRALEKAGVKPGDRVRCGNLEWEW